MVLIGGPLIRRGFFSFSTYNTPVHAVRQSIPSARLQHLLIGLPRGNGNIPPNRKQVVGWSLRSQPAAPSTRNRPSLILGHTERVRISLPPNENPHSETPPKDSPREEVFGKVRNFIWRKRKIIIVWASFTLVWTTFLFAQIGLNRETVPITGRRRYRGSSGKNAEISELRQKVRGEDVDRALERAVATSPGTCLSDDHPQYIRVKGILDRLVTSVGLSSLPWRLMIARDLVLQLTVQASPCIIIMTEGLANVTESDDEIAATLAHELGHFIADHEREQVHQQRLSTSLFVPWLPVMLPGALMTALGALLMEEVILLPGVLMLFVPVAPFFLYSRLKSRSRELEADYIGLLLMTHAGYKPEAAISVQETVHRWHRMLWEEAKRRNPKAKEPHPWTSTHPHSSARIDRMQTVMPKIRTIVSQAGDGDINGERAPANTVLPDTITAWKSFLAESVTKAET